MYGEGVPSNIRRGPGRRARRCAVGYLLAEFVQLDAGDAAALQTSEPPPGSRVFEMATVGRLTLALGQYPEGGGRWCMRSRTGCGGTMRLAYGTAGTQWWHAGIVAAEFGRPEQMIGLFVDKRTAGVDVA